MKNRETPKNGAYFLGLADEGERVLPESRDGSAEARINSLIHAALKNDWDYVDSQLPTESRNPSFLEWASRSGLSHPEGDVRDLAASAFEQADVSRNPFKASYAEARPKLVHNLEDSHPYARFRAACALAAHGANENKPKVIGVLKQFEHDKDVEHIVRRYLSALS